MAHMFLPCFLTCAAGMVQKPRSCQVDECFFFFVALIIPLLMLQINEVTTTTGPCLLLAEDFKAYSKIRVENQFFNK